MPVNPGGPTGNVEARFRVQATLLITPFEPGQTFVAWAPCVTSSISGTGEWLVSGTFGGYGAGDPCDIAHSTPLSSGSAVIAEDLTLGAKGNTVLDVYISPNFFDAAGNLVNEGGFSIAA